MAILHQVTGIALFGGTPLAGGSYGAGGKWAMSEYGGTYDVLVTMPTFAYGRMDLRRGRSQVGGAGKIQPGSTLQLISDGGGTVGQNIGTNPSTTGFATYPYPFGSGPGGGAPIPSWTAYKMDVGTSTYYNQLLPESFYGPDDPYAMKWTLFFWYGGPRYIDMSVDRDYEYHCFIVGLENTGLGLTGIMFKSALDSFNPTDTGTSAGGFSVGNSSRTISNARDMSLRVTTDLTGDKNGRYDTSKTNDGWYGGFDPSGIQQWELGQQSGQVAPGWAPVTGSSDPHSRQTDAVTEIEIGWSPFMQQAPPPSPTPNPKPPIGPPKPKPPPPIVRKPTIAGSPSRPPGPGGSNPNNPTTMILTGSPVSVYPPPTSPPPTQGPGPGGSTTNPPTPPPPGGSGPGSQPTPTGTPGGGGGSPPQPPGTGTPGTSPTSTPPFTPSVNTPYGTPPTPNPCSWPGQIGVPEWTWIPGTQNPARFNFKWRCVTIFCFHGHTEIAMADGTTKRIMYVKVGDEVKVCNTDTNEIITSKVVETSKHPNTKGCLIVNDELKVTPDHHMYDGSNWRAVDSFRVGDDIQYIDQTYKSIDSVEWSNKTMTSYNIMVESEYHNYYANGYLAHNGHKSKTVRGKCWIQTTPVPHTLWKPTEGEPGGVAPTVPISLFYSCSCTPLCGSPVSMKKVYQGIIHDGDTKPTLIGDCTSSGAQPWQTQHVQFEIRKLPAWFENNFFDKGLNISSFGAINVSGALVGMSEIGSVSSTDKSSTAVEPIKRDESWQVQQGTEPSQDTWDKIIKYPIYIKNYKSLLTVPVSAPGGFGAYLDQEKRYLQGLEPVGQLYWNPYYNIATSATFVSHMFHSFSRTLTAANYEVPGFSIFFAPTDGLRGYQPMTLSSPDYYVGSAAPPALFISQVGWLQQGTGYPTNSHICYQVEGPEGYTEMLSGYGIRSFPIPAPGLNPQPSYVPTTRSSQLTGYHPIKSRWSQWSCIGRDYLTRPRRAAPTSNPVIQHAYLHNYVRRFDLWNGQCNDQSWREHGFQFQTGMDPLSGRVYTITHGAYPGTTAQHILSARMRFEMNYSTDWHVAEFTDFLTMSAYGTELMHAFLVSMDKLATNAPISASNSSIALLGYCSYNGSLTAAAADGLSQPCHYVLGCTFHNVPVNCETAGNINNFVVCTSGTDLFLPYIVSRTLSSNEI